MVVESVDRSGERSRSYQIVGCRGQSKSCLKMNCSKLASLAFAEDQRDRLFDVDMEQKWER